MGNIRLVRIARWRNVRTTRVKEGGKAWQSKGVILMSESETAQKAKQLIKSVDDLITTVKKDTAKVIQAAKELNEKVKRGK